MPAVFPDRAVMPDPGAFVPAVGPAAARWRALTEWLASTYGLEPEPLWWGSDGWVLRYRRSGKSLVTLIPEAEGFRALVVVGPSVAPDVAMLDLSQPTREAFAEAKPYPDGRWLFLRVDGEGDVADVERLVALKSPPPRRPRGARPTGTV